MEKRFRQICTELGLSQIQFEQFLEKRQRAISHYEEGILPDKKTRRILSSRRYSIDWLLTGQGRMHLRLMKKTPASRKGREQVSEFKSPTLPDHAHDGMLIVQDGVRQYVNKALAEITCYSIEELVGAPFASIVVSGKREELLQE